MSHSPTQPNLQTFPGRAYKKYFLITKVKTDLQFRAPGSRFTKTLLVKIRFCFVEVPYILSIGYLFANVRFKQSHVIGQLTLPGGRLLKLDKQWEENKLQLFLYSDGEGGQVRPQQCSH